MDGEEGRTGEVRRDREDVDWKERRRVRELVGRRSKGGKA